MRLSILLALTAAIGLSLASGAEAQRRQAPYDLWCRDMRLGYDGGTVPTCWAYTYQQCMASRTSPGERCYLNPRHDPRWRRR